MRNFAATPTGRDLRAARELVRPVEDDPRVDAIAIFGSVARGEAGPRSDTDVLVVHRGALPDDLDDLVPDEVTMTFYRPARLALLGKRNQLFSLHLASESRVLVDPSGVLARALAGVSSVPSLDVPTHVEVTRRRLRGLIDQPRGLHGDPHASAGELYALAKQGAMIYCAAEGLPEFNRHRALRRIYSATCVSPADRRNIDALEQQWHEGRTRTLDRNPPSDIAAAAGAVERLLSALDT